MTFPCRPPNEIGHGEAYEQACFNYLMLCFHLAPLIQQDFTPAMNELIEAARDIQRARMVLVS